MADIRVSGTTTNAALPSVLTTKQQIVNLPGYKAWLRAQDDYMTLVTSGADQFVQQFKDYSGGGQTFTSNEAGPSYAKRVVNSIGGFEAAFFADTVSPVDPYDRYTASGFTFDWAQSWTVAGIVQADPSIAAVTATVASVGATAADTKVFIGTNNTGNFQLGLGNAGTINRPLKTDGAFSFIASFYADPTTPAQSKFTLETEGVRGVDVTRAPLAANVQLPTIGSFGNAQGWVGPMREVLFLQQPVHYGTGGSTAVRDLLRKHAQRIYGVA